MRRSAEAIHGFTLIETLVALAIIAIALAAGLRALSANTDTVMEMKTRMAASWVASNVLHQMLAFREFPELGAKEGKATQGKEDFIWRQEVSITPNYSFRRVEVKVFSHDAPQHAVASMVSYVARH